VIAKIVLFDNVKDPTMDQGKLDPSAWASLR
jgi:hypothetical protein